MVVIAKDEKGDTSYFSILCLDEYKSRVDNIFSKKSIPTYLQLMLILRPGKTIRIPTSKPLSRTAKILSNFIYIGDEKIPYID